jgi:hypothetical protein
METVLTAFIIIFIILFAVLTLSYVFLSTQDTIHASWQEMETRLGEQARTNLQPVSGRFISAELVMELVYRNVGSTRLAAFDEWDVIVQYYDDAVPGNYHVDWLPYNTSTPANNEWTVEGIYLDTAEAIAEVYEPDVLNPGEEIRLRVVLNPVVGPGNTVQTVLATPNGISSALMFTRNIPPVLAINAGLTLASGSTVMIDPMLLQTTDADNTPVELVYTITIPPVQGTLSPETTFTQDDIDNGLVSYTHTGSGSDSFSFTVSDGEDTIGEYVVTVTIINAIPVLMTNTGLTLASGGTATIDNTLLATSDADDLPGDLVYTVTTAPTQGTLSPSGTFTQANIDSGALSYTHTGSGSDSFMFTVSDGEVTVGDYTFEIVVP